MRSLVYAILAASAVAQDYNIPFTVQSNEDLPPLPALTKRRQYEQPCSEVAELWAAQKAQNAKPGATATTIRVPAQLAYDCLMSVPVDVNGDVKEIEELKAYLEYQSTLTWLKKGVADQVAPYDLMGGLNAIAQGAKNGTYRSDFEVQLSIRRLLDGAGDFHLRYSPDIVGIFQWSRPGGQIVSLSEDGVSLPKLYMTLDVPESASGKLTGSPVVKINGEDASQALQKLSDGTKFHDADTRYNTVFPNPARAARGADDGGLSSTHYVYPGANTTYTFANGTSRTIENIAFIRPIFDFTKVTDGPSFFKKFCSGPPAAASSAPASSAKPSSVATPTPAPSPSLIGYPKPVFIHGSKAVSGYYVSDNNYKDVAVLALPAFDPASVTVKSDVAAAGIKEVQKLLRTFFADSVKQGKKKLIIDLRGNGGGFIDMGFEIFKQLFPTVEPYGAARYRAHEAFHYYSALVADVAVEGKHKDGIVNNMEWDDADYGISSTFLWSNILDINGKPYKSYKDYYAPETINGDTFTSVRRYNFSNPRGGHTTSVSLTGYLDQRPAPAQPFSPENIVLLQDGFCGSTCAIFAELMREQGKVQTIAIGGRPQNKPMQGVGGSKGTQVLTFDTLYDFADRTLKLAQALDGAVVANYLRNTAVGRIANATQIFQRSFPVAGTHALGAVNSLSAQRMNDSSSTPLEFVYEAADCRLFYTMASLIDPVNLWKMVADAKWGGAKCVPGSTGHASAIGVVEKKPLGGTKGSSSGSAAGISVPVDGTSNSAGELRSSGLAVGFAALFALVMAV